MAKVKTYHSNELGKVTIPIPDELNPAYILQGIHTSLLCKVVKGEIDLLVVARKELQSRGLDENGAWIGFD